MVPFGYYWSVVHEETGEVVNDGFTREALPASAIGSFPDTVPGFLRKVIPLYDKE
jgi:hypothetical protein